jgi:hypothetical protein
LILGNNKITGIAYLNESSGEENKHHLRNSGAKSINSKSNEEKKYE